MFAGSVGLMTYRTSILGRLALAVSLGLAASVACGGSDMTTDEMAGATGSGGTAGATGTGGSPSTTGGTTGEAGSSTGGTSTAGQGGMDPGVTPPSEGPVVCEGDEDCAESGQVCAGFRRVCVDCANNGDCGDGAICVNEVCEERPTCEDSLDCPTTDLVCVTGEGGPGPGPSEGLCLECGSDADCAEEESCANNVCVRGCGSDKDCTPLGQLCDFDTGSCVECLGAAQCSEGQYCSDGACLEAVCTPGETVCVGEGITSCNDVGSGYGDIDPCFNGTCEVVDGVASCVSED